MEAAASALDQLPDDRAKTTAVLKDDKFGWNLLDVAAYTRNAHMVRLLLKHAEPRFIGDGKERFQTAFVIGYKADTNNYAVEYLLLGYRDDCRINPLVKAFKSTSLFDRLDQSSLRPSSRHFPIRSVYVSVWKTGRPRRFLFRLWSQSRKVSGGDKTI